MTTQRRLHVREPERERWRKGLPALDFTPPPLNTQQLHGRLLCDVEAQQTPRNQPHGRGAERKQTLCELAPGWETAVLLFACCCRLREFWLMESLPLIKYSVSLLSLHVSEATEADAFLRCQQCRAV